MTNKSKRTYGRNTRERKASSQFGTLKYASLTYISSGWVLTLLPETVQQPYVLYTERGKPRIFKTIDSACKSAYEIGISTITIMMDRYRPDN